jgi:hypothetical protein
MVKYLTAGQMKFLAMGQRRMRLMRISQGRTVKPWWLIVLIKQVMSAL